MCRLGRTCELSPEPVAMAIFDAIDLPEPRPESIERERAGHSPSVSPALPSRLSILYHENERTKVLQSFTLAPLSPCRPIQLRLCAPAIIQQRLCQSPVTAAPGSRARLECGVLR